MSPPPAVALLLCEDHPKWHDFAAMAAAFVDAPLVVYRCFADELPSADAHDAFLVSGSRHSVHDPAPWHEALRTFLRRITADRRKRVVGLCYGAQALACALGGAVGPVDGAFRFGVEDVHVDAVALGTVRAARWTSVLAGAPSTLRLCASHGECVRAAPPGTTVTLASSAGAAHEIFVCGPHANALGVQCHPELAGAVAAERIAPALVDKGVLTAEAADAATRALRAHDGADAAVLARAARAFLACGS